MLTMPFMKYEKHLSDFSEAISRWFLVSLPLFILPLEPLTHDVCNPPVPHLPPYHRILFGPHWPPFLIVGTYHRKPCLSV